MHVTSPRKGNKPVRALKALGPQPSELSRHLVRAQEEERKRISRELHDGTGQGLMVLRLYLGMLASDSLGPEAQLKTQEALRLLDHAIEDLRRIVGRLSPRVLEELGLLAAIRKEVRELCRSTGMLASVAVPRELGPLGHETEVALYRSLQEALHNIAKHSRARNITVRLEAGDGLVALLVEDDGVGFPAKRTSRAGAFGLFGMRERVAALGGKVHIRSRKGSGVRIRVMLPAPRSTLSALAPLSPKALEAFAVAAASSNSASHSSSSRVAAGR